MFSKFTNPLNKHPRSVSVQLDGEIVDIDNFDGDEEAGEVVPPDVVDIPDPSAPSNLPPSNSSCLYYHGWRGRLRRAET